MEDELKERQKVSRTHKGEACLRWRWHCRHVPLMVTALIKNLVWLCTSCSPLCPTLCQPPDQHGPTACSLHTIKRASTTAVRDLRFASPRNRICESLGVHTELVYRVAPVDCKTARTGRGKPSSRDAVILRSDAASGVFIQQHCWRAGGRRSCGIMYRP